MDQATRELVRRRAGDRCEYCLIPQEATPFFTFHVDRIIAKQHVGETDDPARLALACNRCNAQKGPNLTGVDSETGEIVQLFNPRQDSWADHFTLHGGEVVGNTPTGRATVRLLNMNSPHRVELRDAWLDEEGDL